MVILSDDDAESIAAALDVLAHDGAVTPARLDRLRVLLSIDAVALD